MCCHNVFIVSEFFRTSSLSKNLFTFQLVTFRKMFLFFCFITSLGFTFYFSFFCLPFDVIRCTLVFLNLKIKRNSLFPILFFYFYFCSAHFSPFQRLVFCSFPTLLYSSHLYFKRRREEKATTTQEGKAAPSPKRGGRKQHHNASFTGNKEVKRAPLQKTRLTPQL